MLPSIVASSAGEKQTAASATCHKSEMLVVQHGYAATSAIHRSRLEVLSEALDEAVKREKHLAL